MTVSVAGLRELANTSASLHDNKGISVDTKLSLNVSRREVSPACIAGVLASRPNFSALCGLTKL